MLGLLALAVLLAPAAAMAAPVYERVEVGGVAQVLRAPVGGFANTEQSGRLAYHSDNDRLYWSGHTSAGHSYFWVDPTLTGNLGGSHDSSTGAVKSYKLGGSPPPIISDVYAGTVTGAVKSVLHSSNVGMAYLPPEQTVLTMVSTGNNAPIRSFQAAASVGGGDVVWEGTSASKVNSGRHRYDDGSGGLTTGFHKWGLAYLGEDATDYHFLFIDNRNSGGQNGKTMKWGKTPGTPVGPTTVGVRPISITSGTVTSTQLNGLVPGINDYVKAIGNDAAGNIYALSGEAGGTNYVSAFSAAGGFSQIDLDPDDDNGAGSMYLDLTGLITDTPDTSNITGHGIAVNADASLIWIAASSGSSSTPDNIFVFETTEEPPIPEPGVLVLGLLGMPMLLRRRRR
jgi:hypothetical protein